MEQLIFESKLSHAQTPEALAELAAELIEDSLEKKPTALKVFLKQLEVLLDKGIDPNMTIDNTTFIYDLQYGYTRYHLDAAKMIFDRCGLPTVLDDEGLTFMQYIRSKMDYNYFGCDYIVKLYLLCCAYDTTGEPNGLTFRKHLYAEMFDPHKCYISAIDAETPLTLSPAIFKNIHRYEHTVEMKKQKRGYYGCWALHIFDKKTRIEVATYY